MKVGDSLDNGRYVLTERLGSGGMAEVFKADCFAQSGHRMRPRCVKALLPEFAQNEELVRLFLDECRLMALLHHNHIIAGEFASTEHGRPYLVMDWIDGVDLGGLLDGLRGRGRAMPIDVALYIAGAVLQALDYAHRKLHKGELLRLVHRDVSPGNILLARNGDVLLTDFGIARATIRTDKTLLGNVRGKFGYMPPEQLRPVPLDGRTDLFALGVVLYEMLTGERPFRAPERDYLYVEEIEKDRRFRVRERRPEVPVEIERVIDGLLVGDREKRTASAHDALKALGETWSWPAIVELKALAEEFAAMPKAQAEPTAAGWKRGT